MSNKPEHANRKNCQEKREQPDDTASGQIISASMPQTETVDESPAITAKPERGIAAAEHDILDFWSTKEIFQKLRTKNAEGPYFRFIDGPITANNPMGVHHGYARTLKDLALRYKALRGFRTAFQPGFDCQGLWVEVQVEKDLGLGHKKEVEQYGLAEFNQKCRERVERFSRIQTRQSIRLGQWMDWPNSYYTHSDGNIEGIWKFLAKCQENGWLYKGQRPIQWCARCGTGRENT